MTRSTCSTARRPTWRRSWRTAAGWPACATGPGKICGQAVRLAALLELAARAEDGRPLWTEPVGPWAMDGAVRLTRALTTHALSVLSEMGVDRHTDGPAVRAPAGRRAARRAPRSGTCTTRHATGRGWRPWTTSGPWWTSWWSRGCLRLVEQDRQGPGRPPSPRVELHPVLARCDRETHPQNPQNRAGAPNTGGSAGLAGVNPEPHPDDDSDLWTADEVASMTRPDTARRIARKVSERVRDVAPAGLGHWGPAWDRVEYPSRALLDALHRWEMAVDPSPDAEQALRGAVNEAASELVAAWADAAAAWEAAGRPVVRWTAGEPETAGAGQ